MHPLFALGRGFYLPPLSAVQRKHTVHRTPPPSPQFYYGQPGNSCRWWLRKRQTRTTPDFMCSERGSSSLEGFQWSMYRRRSSEVKTRPIAVPMSGLCRPESLDPEVEFWEHFGLLSRPVIGLGNSTLFSCEPVHAWFTDGITLQLTGGLVDKNEDNFVCRDLFVGLSSNSFDMTSEIRNWKPNGENTSCSR